MIDGYVIISRELATTDNLEAKSRALLREAQLTYHKNHVMCSDDKTVEGETCFKAIGAEFFSDEKARHAGVVTAGAPLSKRLPMVALSLKAAALPVISKALASRLAGNWVSIFMCRRQCGCLLSLASVLGRCLSAL